MTYLQEKYQLVMGENNPLLRTVCEKVKLPLSVEHREFAMTLIELMWDYDGVGLAAPQVGLPLRIMATTQWDIKGKDYKHLSDTVMINPEIIKVSDKTLVTEEGCLSLPGMSGYVERPAEVTISFVGIDGKRIEKCYKGFDAIVILHEIDHLDGVMFIDKITKEKPRGEL